MKPLLLLAVVAALALTGCAPTSVESSASTAPSASETSLAIEAATISAALPFLGCETEMIEAGEAPVVETLACLPHTGGSVFAWGLESHDAAVAWLDTDPIDVGGGDVLYLSGAVVLLGDEEAAPRLDEAFVRV